MDIIKLIIINFLVKKNIILLMEMMEIKLLLGQMEKIINFGQDITLSQTD